MKTLFLSLFLSVAIAATAQQPKVSCDVLINADANSFATALIKQVPSYDYVKRDTVGKNIVLFYSNKDKEQLQVWYKMRDDKYVVARVVGQYSAIQKVYADFLGRNYNAAATEALGHDAWDVDCCGKKTMIRIYKMETAGYWNMEFSI